MTGLLPHSSCWCTRLGGIRERFAFSDGFNGGGAVAVLLTGSALATVHAYRRKQSRGHPFRRRVGAFSFRSAILRRRILVMRWYTPLAWRIPGIAIIHGETFLGRHHELCSGRRGSVLQQKKNASIENVSEQRNKHGMMCWSKCCAYIADGTISIVLRLVPMQEQRLTAVCSNGVSSLFGGNEFSMSILAVCLWS